jgi:hypothetical protein
VKAYFDQPDPGRLRVSEQGDVVEFALDGRNDTTFHTDLNIPDLRPGPATGSELRGPSLSSKDLQLHLTSDFSRATVNGKRLDLERWETTSGWAIAPSEEAFLLGTRFSLRKIGSGGKSIWSIDPGSEVWAVNVSGDNRFAIAALGDGTIRWFQMETGKLVFSLFVHGDGKRWAAWTPTGLFYAPPNSRDLVVSYQNEQNVDIPPSVLTAEELATAHFRSDLFATLLNPRSARTAPTRVP